jgi:hypothetical protein
VVIAEVGIVQCSADNNGPLNGDHDNSHHKHYSNQDWVLTSRFAVVKKRRLYFEEDINILYMSQ